jgi:hypothetical protein
MEPIASLGQSATQAAQALAAGQANTAAGTGQTKSPPSGLPPVNLAQAASANTVNAELVSSQWGIDPATVGGVYGGAGASGGLFSGDNLLPLLTNLSHANAEQALSLVGIQTPTPRTAASTAAGTGAAAAATAAAAAGQSAAAQATSGSSTGVIVDPLWGRSA